MRKPPASPPPDVGALVDALFARLFGFYGRRWVELWQTGQTLPDGTDAGICAAKRVWAAELADLTATEVGRGLAACRGLKFPPSLPEFLAAARPAIDPQAAHAEAVEQLRLRERDADRWSHPAIYWSTVEIGAHDLLAQPYAAIRARWCAVLERHLARDCLPVPKRLVALESPERAGSAAQQTRRERTAQAQRELAALVERMRGAP